MISDRRIWLQNEAKQAFSLAFVLKRSPFFVSVAMLQVPEAETGGWVGGALAGGQAITGFLFPSLSCWKLLNITTEGQISYSTNHHFPCHSPTFSILEVVLQIPLDLKDNFKVKLTQHRLFQNWSVSWTHFIGKCSFTKKYSRDSKATTFICHCVEWSLSK